MKVILLDLKDKTNPPLIMTLQEYVNMVNEELTEARLLIVED